MDAAVNGRQETETGSMAVDMRLPKTVTSLPAALVDRKDLVVPGDVITSDTGFMRWVLSLPYKIKYKT